MDTEKALTDPAAVFSTPREVVAEQALNTDQKIQILRRWEYDARELSVAEEENMSGGDGELLDQVLRCLHELGFSQDQGEGSPTKQGGV
ncbi:hypothetical protein DES49_0961 [Halospina denitrificans]|uniref:Uncharacterized protein n=1 Tax=Halospina denitrificans TaxID=332522 RepID=A0A4R7JXF7_9GAMM|nr:hypothetical protein [Halospina denitrificans]TDT43151.1 hypothetical protein DES49_0961 [Halospina denitrificans]